MQSSQRRARTDGTGTRPPTGPVLTSLPQVLVAHMLAWLSPVAAARCHRVCRAWRAVDWCAVTVWSTLEVDGGEAATLAALQKARAGARTTHLRLHHWQLHLSLREMAALVPRLERLTLVSPVYLGNDLTPLLVLPTLTHVDFGDSTCWWLDELLAKAKAARPGAAPLRLYSLAARRAHPGHSIAAMCAALEPGRLRELRLAISSDESTSFLIDLPALVVLELNMVTRFGVDTLRPDSIECLLAKHLPNRRQMMEIRLVHTHNTRGHADARGPPVENPNWPVAAAVFEGLDAIEVLHIAVGVVVDVTPLFAAARRPPPAYRHLHLCCSHAARRELWSTLAATPGWCPTLEHADLHVWAPDAQAYRPCLPLPGGDVASPSLEWLATFARLHPRLETWPSWVVGAADQAANGPTLRPAHVETIAAHCTALRRLELAADADLDMPLAAVCAANRALQSLMVNAFVAAGAVHDVWSSALLMSFALHAPRALTDISMRGGVAISDRALETLARACPQLHKLHLEGTRSVVRIAAVREVVTQCTELRRLELHGLEVVVRHGGYDTDGTPRTAMLDEQRAWRALARRTDACSVELHRIDAPRLWPELGAAQRIGQDPDTLCFTVV